MSAQPTRVLLIEDNPIDAAVIERRLLSGAAMACAVTVVGSLEEAWPILDVEGVDIIITDLNLPGSDGLDTLGALRARVPHVPIVVLTASSEASIGIRAVQMGAQDFLEKGSFDGRLIQRALIYAIERHRLVQTLHDLSLLDPLTGLYNRRGLVAVAGKRAEVARRVGCRAFVLYADLDHLKAVNDEFGHAAGDTYIQLGAEAMKQSFRAADVLARVGGDEFVVVGVEATSFEPPLLVQRIQRVLERLAREHRVNYAVSISCGIVRFDPAATTVDAAMQEADAEMYAVKRARKAGGPDPAPAP